MERPNSLFVEGFIGFDPTMICRGDYSIIYVSPSDDTLRGQVLKSTSRRNTHMQTKAPIARAMAAKIHEEVQKKSETAVEKPEQQPEFVVAGLMKKDKAVPDTGLAQEIEFTSKAHPAKTRNGLISVVRTEMIQTYAKTFGQLNSYLTEETSKRKPDNGPEVKHPNQKRVKMSSFDTNLHKTVADLADRSLEYAVVNAKRVQEAIPTLHRFIQVTPKDVQNILFIPFDSKQKHCVKGQFCQSALVPLRHPLKDEPCMGFIPPIVWDALRLGEKLTPLNTEAELGLFKHDLCEFCFRSWITEQVGNNMLDKEQIPREQILSRHYSTDLPGSWDKSAMIAPERNKKTQHLHGLFGNVPSFNPKNFRPIVAIMTREWEVQSWIEVEEFQRREAEFRTTFVAYGWLETGPFYQMNNMMQPKVNQQDPYLNVIMEVEGGYSVSSILVGYFKNYAGADYSNVFRPLRELLKKNVFKMTYTGFHPKLLPKFEARGKLRNPKATDLYIKYWPWNEGYVMHPITEDLPYETYRIYYTVIWVMNSVVYLKQFTDYPLPGSITVKLNAFMRMYQPILAYMKEHPFDDVSLNTARLKIPNLEWESSVAFALMPRHGDEQKKFRVEDFQYLTFTYRHHRRATPDMQLRHSYLFLKTISRPHSNEFMEKYEKFDNYLAEKRALPYSCYQEITGTFQMFHSCLRRYVPVEWPADVISHLENMDVTAAFKEGQINIFFQSVRECFVYLLALLNTENNRYSQLVEWAPHVICEFSTTVAWIRRCLNSNGTAKDLFTRLGVQNFNHLLPPGFVATSFGINSVLWSKNIICLALLVRVYILEELWFLEDKNNRNLRYNLILLRNSHFALQRAITENGYLLPVKNDQQLYHRAAARHGLFNAEFTRYHQLTLSIYEANYPLSTREVHEGMLPVSHCMLLNNFFTELEKPSFPFQKIISTTMLKCTVHGEFLETINGTENTPLRHLLYQMLELSLKGLYKSVDIVPGFQTSAQLDVSFRNLDYKPERMAITQWISKSIKNGEEKICFQQFIDHLYMEYVYYNLQCNPVVHDLIVRQYMDEFWTRSLVMMDVFRTVLRRTDSVALEEVHYYTQEKFELKTSRKVLRPNSISFCTFLQFVIIQSDKERYNKWVFCNRIPPTDQINIQDFVRHLDPNGLLYKDDLIIPFNNSEITVECVNQINDIYRKCATTTNIAALIKQAILVISQLDVTHYALLARFSAELFAYRKFRTTQLLDYTFVKGQVDVLCKVSACTQIDDIPQGKIVACIAPCCSSLKKSLANKQFKPVKVDTPGELIVRCTLGNRDLARDPADGSITCGSKAAKQGKRTSQTNSRQRPKKMTLRSNSTAAQHETASLRRIALNQEDMDNAAPALFNFISNEETMNKRVENQRAVEGVALTCEKTEPLMLSLLGNYLDCDQSLKINGAKRREAQMKKSLAKQKADGERVLFNSRPQNVMQGVPPLIIPPCCGELVAYRFLGYTGAGYSCGWCLPLANEILAFRVENICELCYKVLANRPTLNNCLEPDCATSYAKCPHGAFPVMMYDDLYWMCVRKVFICNSCFHAFQSFLKYDFFYTLSIVKRELDDMVRSIISR